MAVPDDPLREDVLVPNQPDDDPLRDDGFAPDEPEDGLRDGVPDVDDATSVVALDERPTTVLPRVSAAPPAASDSRTASLAPWAVFAAVGVVVILATSTWAAWLQGPTADRNAAPPRIDPVQTLTAPAPPAPVTVVPSDPEPAAEPEPDPEPVERSSERPRPTRERAPAPQADTPPPPVAPAEDQEAAGDDASLPAGEPQPAAAEPEEAQPEVAEEASPDDAASPDSARAGTDEDEDTAQGDD